MKGYVKADEVGEDYRWVFAPSKIFYTGYTLRLQKKREFFGWKTVGVAVATSPSHEEEMLTKHVAKVMAGVVRSGVVS